MFIFFALFILTQNMAINLLPRSNFRKKMQNITFCKRTYRCKCVYQYHKYISRNCLPVDEWRIDVKQDLLSIEMNHIGKSSFYVMDAVCNVCSISSLDCENAMLALFAVVYCLEDGFTS